VASSSPTRNASPVVTAVLIALGIVLAIVGVIYFIDTAGHLPSFFPGHQAGSTHHHTKHALLAFGLAALAFIGAWMSAGTKTPR
jgi:MFS superfamily sulfate permease-like transporter